MDPDLVQLVKLVHEVVTEDAERERAERRAARNPNYLPEVTDGCADLDS